MTVLQQTLTAARGLEVDHAVLPLWKHPARLLVQPPALARRQRLLHHRAGAHRRCQQVRARGSARYSTRPPTGRLWRKFVLNKKRKNGTNCTHERILYQRHRREGSGMFRAVAELAQATQSLKAKKFPNPQVEDIPTTGGYTEYSSAPWWKHGDRYQDQSDNYSISNS